MRLGAFAAALALLVTLGLGGPAGATISAGSAGSAKAKKRTSHTKCSPAKKRRRKARRSAAKRCVKHRKRRKPAPPPVPKDYISLASTLSQPVYKDIVHEAIRVPMPDGIELYTEVTRPKAPGRYGVIMEASPYHGDGNRDATFNHLPEKPDGKPLGMVGYFPPRGYAVVVVDLRGTGRSDGCLDHLGPKDRSDLKTIVEWAARQPWSNGRVGIAGHSYVGSTPSAAASMHPKGLATIVPSSGIATMYDHQFQAGVPYSLQWVGPMEGYEELAVDRELPPGVNDPLGDAGGDDFMGHPQNAACGVPQSSLVSGEDQLSGRYSDWDRDRDWRAEATKADIPIFLVHGVNDNAVRSTAIAWFTQRGGRPGDKVWLGQWFHGASDGTGTAPNSRGAQWTYALHAWFDKQLLGRKVDTGPPVEVFMDDAKTLPDGANERTETYAASRWPVLAGTQTLYPAADGSLTEAAPAAGSASFAGDPVGYQDPLSTGHVAFATVPVKADTLYIGTPELDLAVSVSVERVHLIASLYDRSPTGEMRRITQFAMNPELRDGLDKLTPVTPGQRMVLKPPGFVMAQHVHAGHRLELRVTTSDPDKVPLFAIDPQVTVFTGPDATRLRLPVVEGRVYPDKMRVKFPR
jgi:predicted acyl esterase